MIQELSLIQRVQLRDDRHAFAQLVKQHQSKVRFTLLQLTNGQGALADDLAQETFIKAYKSISQFESKASFATWIHRIAYNSFISHTRKRVEETISDIPEVAYEVDHHHEMLQGAINKALLTLPIDQRAAIHYGFQRGHSHSEISQIMNLPLGTVKTLINRGKEKLKQQLQDWQEVEGAR